MGFGKKTDDDDDERPKRKQVSDPKKFEPTTREQWKKISKRARKRDEARDQEKTAKKERAKNRKKHVKNADWIRGQLASADGLLDVRIFRSEFFEALIKAVKDNGGTPPAYHAFEELREVRDARFRFDLHLALARMSWMQHSRLIETAVGQPVPTRDWTEAWHAVCRIVAACFHIRVDNAGNERIKDRDALDDWPIPERKRAVKLSDEEKVHKRDVPHRLERAKKMRKKKGKEDRMTLDMFEEDEKRRLHAARDNDDEDEEEEDDEAEDEEEDEEADDESDDEDDEEDKKSKKSKKSEKSKSDDADEDEEEDEDDEDEDDEDEPKRKKEKRKVSSKKSDKSEKKSKSSSKKPEKKEKEKTSASGGDTFKTVKQFKTGIKAEVQKLIPAKGATLEQVVKAAKGAKLNKSAANIRAYLNWLAANGYLKRV